MSRQLDLVRGLAKGISLAWVAAVLAAGVFFWAGPAPAATYTWDFVTGDSAITDGAPGVWGVGTPNWFDGTSYDQNWADGNAAVFGTGTAGGVPLYASIAISGDVKPTSLTLNQAFDGSSYEINSGRILFTGDGATLTVNAAAGVNSLISTGIGSADRLLGGTMDNNLVINNAGTLTLSGDNYANAILNVTDGGGTMFFEGGGTTNLQGMNRAMRTPGAGTYARGPSFIGQTTAGNTINVQGDYGKLWVSTLRIGMGSNGNNTLNVTSPGTIDNPSVNCMGGVGNDSGYYWGNGLLGDYSSYNAIYVGPGAYFKATDKGFLLGTQTGSDYNTLTVDGGTFDRGSNSGALTIGNAGSNNSMLVQNGGHVVTGRFGIGINGGNDNFVNVTGSGSKIDYTGGTNFMIGAESSYGGSVAGDRNYLLVQNGGEADFNMNGTEGRGYHVGAVAGADDNYVRVTGANSVFRLRQNQPLSIGGATGNNNNNHFITDADNSGNYFKVDDGGAAYLNSLYIMGNSAADPGKTAGKFILGAGGGNVSTAYMQASTGSGIYKPGVTLYNAGTRLEINNGRLVAGADNELVNGPGRVTLNGPAYFSTAYSTSSITSVIEGAGDMTKEAGGTLALTAANTNNGAVNVSQGTLALTGAGSLAGPAVSVSGGATFLANTSANPAIGTSGSPTVYIGGSGTLSTVSAAINALNIASATSGTVLSFADGANLNMEITTGSSGDQILLASGLGASVGSSLFLNVSPLAILTGSNTYTLVSAPGGGLPVAGAGVTVNGLSGYVYDLLSSTATNLILSVSAPTVSDAYFQGNNDNKWNTVVSGQSNWTSDQAGTTNTSYPAPGTKVHFYADNAVTGNLATVLDAATTIYNLTVEGGTQSNAVSITASPAGNTLTIGSSIIGSGGLTVNSGAGALTINAPVTLGQSQTWQNDSSNVVTVNGALGGTTSKTVTLAGTGGVKVTADSTDMPAMTLNANSKMTMTGLMGATGLPDGTTYYGKSYLGAISLAAGSRLELNQNGSTDQTMSHWNGSTNLISGTGTLFKGGTNTLRFAKDNTGFNGTVIIDKGTLELGSKLASTQTWGRQGLGTSQLQLAGGTTVRTQFEGNTSGGALYNAIVLNRTASDSVVYNNGFARFDVSFGTAKDMWISGNVSGDGGIMVIGSGRDQGLTLQGNNTYSGGVAMADPTNPSDTPNISLGSDPALGSGALRCNIINNAVVDKGGLRFNSGLTVDNDISIVSTGRIVLNTLSGNSNLTGIISDDGGPVGGSIIKHNANNLTLSGANTYRGLTRVSGGSLILNNVLAMQNSTLNYNTFGGSLGFGTLTSATLGGIQGNQNLTLQNASSAAVALSVGNNGDSTSYSGVLSGSGSLTKVGAGTTTLTANQTYSGATAANGGVLSLTGNNATSSLTVGTAGAITTPTAGMTMTAGAGSGNVTFNGAATYQVLAAAGGVSKITTNNGNLAINDTPNLRLVSDTTVPAETTSTIIQYAGARSGVDASAWTVDAAPLNAQMNKQSNWLDGDSNWDINTNWSQKSYGGTVSYDDANKRVNLTIAGTPIVPTATTLATIAPANNAAVTGPAAAASVASLTVGDSNGSGYTHSLSLQAGAPLAVSGAITANPSGTLNASAASFSAATLNVTGGTVISGPGSSAGVVNITGSTLSAAAGNEVAVSNNLTIPTVKVTAGTTPFKVGGTSTGTAIGKLLLQGGTTTVSDRNQVWATIGTPHTGVTWATNNGNPISNAFDAGSGAKVLVVDVNWRATNMNAFTQPPVLTYNGVPLIKGAQGLDAGGGNWANTAVYYLMNPDSGSNQLAISFPQGGLTDYAIGAYSLSNVDTTWDPVANGATAGVLPLDTRSTTSLALSNIPLHGAEAASVVYRTNTPATVTITGSITSGTAGSLDTSGPGGGSGNQWKTYASTGATIIGLGMLAKDVTSGSLTLTSTASAASARYGMAAVAFKPNFVSATVNQPGTAVDVTANSVLAFDVPTAATLGDLSIAGSTLTLSNATSLSFNNLTTTGASSLGTTLPLTFRGSSMSVSGGTPSIASAVTLTGAANAVSIAGASDKLTLGGQLDAGSTDVTKSGAGRLVLDNTGTTAALVKSLAISAGKVDLTNDKIVIADKTAAGGLTALRAAIATAYAGGTWTGNGLTSANAAADRAANGATAKTGVGYLDNADPIAGNKTAFYGRSVNSNSLMARYTYYGDANLDGRVNLADFGILKGRYGTGSQWYHGDFDYNGVVNLADFGKLKAAYGSTPITAAAVPEPSVVALLLTGGLIAGFQILRRRRK